MEIKRKDERLDIQLSSSIKEINDTRRSFCIIRNISRRGVFLTAKVKLFAGQTVECIISFEERSIQFIGIVRRASEDYTGNSGYGIEITEITKENAVVLDEFIEAGYLPTMEEEQD